METFEKIIKLITELTMIGLKIPTVKYKHVLRSN